MTDTPDVSGTTLWHTFSVRDADAMMVWLRAIGFTEHATYRDEQDPSVVVHAEWAWPGGGGIMFGSERDDSAISGTGPAAAYLVTDDPDAAFEAAVAAYAARQLGFSDVPLVCARELEIEGSMPRVVRLMAHVETDLPRAEITHAYLHGAANLRRDLARTTSHD